MFTRPHDAPNRLGKSFITLFLRFLMEYLGDANADLASDYAGSANFNPGWYWAGGPYGYTWLPGNGLFWNPGGFSGGGNSGGFHGGGPGSLGGSRGGGGGGHR